MSSSDSCNSSSLLSAKFDSIGWFLMNWKIESISVRIESDNGMEKNIANFYTESALILSDLIRTISKLHGILQTRGLLTILRIKTYRTLSSSVHKNFRKQELFIHNLIQFRRNSLSRIGHDLARRIG
ncbi:hypothetical protein DERP_004239 [Dermatophagoides pteronyssinus]|uniref:Uncharacterized protein n=1 Tax=Dermatophagoides pteronyssinus TaxID=6956 RepID=A0ABQ8J8L5_DERPT|nr:hypothetical protein DERP_004239 [Dermatophagoides pteronyssinus]